MKQFKLKQKNSMQHALNNNGTYLNSFGVEHIPKEIIKIIGNKNIKTNNFRIQTIDSVTCGCLFIGFVHFMLKCKRLTDFTNLSLPNNFEKNDSIILSYFMTNF